MKHDIILHHSSKSGINGQIAPLSRDKCDFGKGFYLGTMEEQTQALVISDKYQDPIYYRIKFKLSEIPDDKILTLKDMEWAYFVLYNRRELEELKGTSFYEYYSHLADNKDLIIGPIADDNMRSALLDFEDGYITDVALKNCLKSVNYGTQYVAKTEFACSKCIILESSYVKREMDIEKIRQFSEQRKAEGNAIYQSIRRTNRRDGYYIDELKEKALENSLTDIFLDFQ